MWIVITGIATIVTGKAVPSVVVGSDDHALESGTGRGKGGDRLWAHIGDTHGDEVLACPPCLFAAQ